MKELKQNNMIYRNIAVKLSFIIMFFCGFVNAQNTTSFPIVSTETKASIVIDDKDAEVVQIAAKMLVDDIFKVSGKQISSKDKQAPFQIIAGTLGQSKLINEFVVNNKIDVSDVKGKWETFKILVVENPSKNIKKSLVIIGSDRRATAYGLLEISRMIGVSPWEWWADATPNKQLNLELNITNTKYGSPSVKYRGIFLNDEDWGLQKWAALNFEPETGDIGPKTYAKVFELLLRLRANTIWPAMHTCTKAFYHYPQNKVVADKYAIVIGSSHAEPMLCNVNAEWNHDTMGEYRYDTNAEVIKNLFKKRAKETANYDGIYTVGMRGEHDSPMIVGEDDTDSQVKLLERVITDQRNILKNYTVKGEQKPQAFVPYKEVLHYYQNGLKLPEDITLVWTDDNYGYMRQLSNPEEQKRSGGAGVYYHTSYWGRPHDYLWLNSTNPVLMWEEMAKAYEFKSRDLWILNCGDIKPHEYNIELFLDMAWDMTNYKESESVKKHMTNWTAREFGSEKSNAITAILFEQNRLAYQRRPEFMAWSQVEPIIKSGETELTQYHYGDEVSTRIDAYQELMNSAEVIKGDIPSHKQDAFYQLVYYPIIGAASLNNKWLYAFKNDFVAKQGRKSASFFGEKSMESYNRIVSETKYYNETMKNGKWNHIMSMAPRHLPVFSKPTIATTTENSKPKLGIALESYQMELNNKIVNSYANVLPVFNAYTQNSYYIDLFVTGSGTVNWEAKPKADWIKITKTSGELNKNKLEERLWVTIDWDKVPEGENKKEAPLGHDYQLIPPSYKVNSMIDFVTKDTVTSIGVSTFNPKFKALDSYHGFIEDKGFISINAENSTSKKAGKVASWDVFEGIGYTGKVAVALPRSAESETEIASIVKNSPVLEYDFYSFNFGQADVYLQAVPTHALYEGRGVRCAVAIDDANPVIVDFQTFDRSETWKQNVLKNAAVESAKQIINKSGKHTLKIWMVDSGVMIDQILIDLGGWKKSYMFPPETKM
ncbi:glycosyl hydrolase 115 family protein [Flavobacterium algicola]|uniref:glycosyl hydrolase 115 family protein n=1 Tax=Flavobacterium algicola TaxID=556529 RepID=UPI001EFEE4C4|nr:glycosyl hydrolase 115 family protein [Flavobacterium algicola]MCG9793169.1 glycosyl hydrolase 115 family protein [Flavobacterium algicola]